MAVSTIPAAKQALLDRLTARSGLSGVQVTWGIPPSPGAEWIWLGDAEPDSQQAAALGQQRREEAYTLACVVSVLRQGTDQRGASLRAFEIAEEVAAEVRADATLGGVVRWCQVVEAGLIERHDDTKREGRVVMHLACRARI